ALCDVDARRASRLFKSHGKTAKIFKDFRRLLDKERKNVDAVVISTTDHVHIPASVMALKRGIHVYCEKPLGHNIGEVREATKVAKRYGLATQMGNGAHSGHNYRSVVKMIKSGIIGEVKEAHCWCDESWPSKNRPKETPPIPKTLKWDLWLGPAPYRPYHRCYLPLSWRGWWDFGNGRIGDMGCHMIDLPFSALNLKYPLTVESRRSTPIYTESAPKWLISKWTFPKRGKLPPVELTWYDGDQRPPLQKKHNMPDWPEATIFVGSKGMMIADYGRFKLFPEKDFKGVKRPRLTNVMSHHAEWIKACKTGSSTGTDFAYAGPLTETILLGAVACRAGKKLEWDAVNLKATNCPQADQYIARENRKGWEL
ncbi:MAG: Gfo/Idh/MocA family oxidoreductase, partial [Phycisphaerae bacterium]|nr:Gfo/Idh/MocA family oxidoreductase [Phycisphaerae bacterium]